MAILRVLACACAGLSQAPVLRGARVRKSLQQRCVALARCSGVCTGSSRNGSKEAVGTFAGRKKRSSAICV
eukprot:9716052-Alexandrium_andersonii.AAC.1